jgi:hypothetical protein
MNFPYLPGIPPLLTQVIPAVVTLAAGPITALLQSFAPKWQLLDKDGKDALIPIPDSFVGLQYSNSHRISDYPLEKGSFAFYNTVQTPFSATVRVTKGGSVDDRKSFLSAIDVLSKSLDVYTLSTPECVYEKLSIERYDYMRSVSNGAGMMIVDIHFLEIRLAQVQYSASNGTINSAGTIPSAVAGVHSGQIAPTTPSASALSSLQGRIL